MKKQILFCSNCQGNAIYIYLKTCNEFNELYNVDYIENWILLKTIDKTKYIEKLKTCDILIYQPLKAKHNDLSTETENGLKNYLKTNCILISFPYIYNSAFWPFFHHVSNEDEFHPYLSIRQVRNYEVLSELLVKYNKDEIYDMYNKDLINFQYKVNFENSIKILKDNELNTNIKVAGYILENYKDKRLFLIKDHPTKYILIYCANKILEILNINYIINENDFIENHHGMTDSQYNRLACNWPITEQCSKDLGLTFYDNDGKAFFRDLLNKIL
jgi:hypothetical protein